MTANEHISLSEQEFDDQYNPILADSGDLLQFDDVKHLDPRYVWTIVEGDDEPVDDEDAEDHGFGFANNWYAIPGFHIVNKLGYVRSETPWPHDNIQAIYYDVTN